MTQQEYKSPYLDYIALFPQEYKDGTSYPTIICLHGFGVEKSNLTGLAESLGLEGYLWLFPDAPQLAYDEADPTARAWYTRGGAETPEEVAEAVSALEGFYTEAQQRHHFVDGRVVLLGFSQGGAMTLRYGLSRPEVFCGLVVLSGSLRKTEDLLPRLPPRPARQGYPIFLAHGLLDQVVRVEVGHQVNQFLQGQGYQPEYRTYRMGHYISPQLMEDLQRWVSQVLPPLQENLSN
ncbi:MAG: alpha/beta hydrolase [Gemmataceae bacterium]